MRVGKKPMKIKETHCEVRNELNREYFVPRHSQFEPKSRNFQIPNEYDVCALPSPDNIPNTASGHSNSFSTFPKLICFPPYILDALQTNRNQIHDLGSAWVRIAHSTPSRHPSKSNRHGFKMAEMVTPENQGQTSYVPGQERL